MSIPVRRAYESYFLSRIWSWRGRCSEQAHASEPRNPTALYGLDTRTRAVAVRGEPQGEQEVANAANRDKNELLASASDEIRAPIDGILTTLEQVLETSLSHQQRQSLEIVRSAAGDVLGMLNDPRPTGAENAAAASGS